VLSANHTTSLFFISGFGAGAYAAKDTVNPPSRRSPVVGFGLILEGWNGDRTDEMEIETSRSRDPDLLRHFGEIMVLWGAWGRPHELEHRYRQTLFRQALFHKSLFGVGQLGIEHALIPINVSLVCA